jgi:aryl-alcohol dehydrogenase-like predicted oxidoreductase
VRTRPIGEPTELTTATVVGAGDVCLARSALRGVDRDEVGRTLSQLVELGGTLIECSAEVDAAALVGDLVRGLRARDRVATVVRVGAAASTLALARTVQASVEASLRASRLDALPVAVIAPRAAWRDDTAWPELVGACARLVRDGKVMRWGAAIDVADVAAGAAPWLAEPWLHALRVELSLCDRRMAAIADALGKDRAVLVARPLAGGALAGALGPGVPLSPRDDRRAIDAAGLTRVSAGVAALAPFTRDVPAAARASEAGKQRLDGLVRVEPVECSDVAELALRWAIDRVPGGGIALPRLHRGHVAAAVAAASAPPLSRDLLARLADLDI